REIKRSRSNPHTPSSHTSNSRTPYSLNGQASTPNTANGQVSPPVSSSNALSIQGRVNSQSSVSGKGKPIQPRGTQFSPSHIPSSSSPQQMRPQLLPNSTPLRHEQGSWGKKTFPPDQHEIQQNGFHPRHLTQQSPPLRERGSRRMESRELPPRPPKANVRKPRPQKSRNGRSLSSHPSSLAANGPMGTGHRQPTVHSALNHSGLKRSGLSPVKEQHRADLMHSSFAHRDPSTQVPFMPSGAGNGQFVHLPNQRGRTQTLHPRPIQSRSLTRSKSALSTRSSSQASSPLRRRTTKTSVSPLVYAVRLLILGTGLGVVAGTIISVLDPSSLPGSSAGGDRSENSTEQTDTAVGTTTNIGIDPANALGASPLASSNALRTLDLNAFPKRQAYTELASQLDAMGQAQSGLFPGVFAIDLDTYNYVGVNEAVTFSAASTIKVPVLIAFFQDVEQNKIRLDETMTMTAEDVASGSGDMQWGAVGDTYTAIETATKMIVISDNTATNMLIRRMGGAEVLNQRFRSWGLNLTQIRNPLPDLEGTNTTSPSELTHLMAMVSEGKLLSMRSRDRMLDIMYRTQTATLLPAGIGGDAAIAHKTGDIGLMVGDTGLVDSPNGKRYAITILMRRPHNDNRAQELIRQMAGLIHEELQSPPSPPPESQSIDFSPDGPPPTDTTVETDQ
ncbi:MAG: hypothetical protein F6K09_23695, partial [Merismopedia sp. SIO2A8]|nr:hypothetical protein [Merismopedia sp. SIO2A8]